MCCSQVLVSFDINARDTSETQNLKETGSLPMSVNFSVMLGFFAVRTFHQPYSSYYMPLRRCADIHSSVSLTASGGLLQCHFFLWGRRACFVWNVVLYVEGWQIACWRDEGGKF
jgi:hypothetical protein